LQPAARSKGADMQPFKTDFGALEWQAPLPGARFKAFRANGKQIRLVEFTSEFVEPDWCEKGHIGMVLDGTIEVDFRGERIIYERGDGVFIPAGAGGGHKARSLTPVVRLVLVEEDT
jgi:quercetin dioxygenase-like cupin family protein